MQREESGFGNVAPPVACKLSTSSLTNVPMFPTPSSIPVSVVPIFPIVYSFGRFGQQELQRRTDSEERAAEDVERGLVAMSAKPVPCLSRAVMPRPESKGNLL